MKIRLTKAAVLDILINEDPIRFAAGNWVDSDAGPHSNLDTCSRCAVGSVLLGAIQEFPGKPLDLGWHVIYAERPDSCAYCPVSFDPPDEEDELYETEIYAEAENAIANGRPLHALSIVFEGLCAQRDPSCADTLSLEDRVVIHDKVIGFVLAHFPDSIVMDIDGAVPKDIPGLTVVDG